jgi:hypothetical protein
MSQRFDCTLIPACLEMLQDSLPAGHFRPQRIAERPTHMFGFAILFGFFGKIEQK